MTDHTPLDDVPSWALMAELKRRGDLRIAPSSEAGQVKRERQPDGFTCDSRGLPLYQVMFDTSEAPEVHAFMPQPGCNVCVCGALRDDPYHLREVTP